MGKKSESNKNEKLKFCIDNNRLFSLKDGIKSLVANFTLRIEKQIILEDDGVPRGRLLEILFKSVEREIPFTIPSDEFSTGRLGKRIMEVAGSSAIIYGSTKGLVIGTQALSGKVAEQIVRSRGLTPDGNYLSEGMMITPKGIENSGEIHVYAGDGNLAKRLKFLRPGNLKRLQQVGRHLCRDFLELKSHAVTYPLIGHISLSPFASEIPRLLGTEKVALHLEGPSGGGKTFLATLGMLFFGEYQEKIPAWISTPNFLEAEGYWFRDALFLVDDYKQGLIPQESIIRVLQNYSGGHGRGRLKSNSIVQSAPFIRGLLLSTGEDFVSDVESVTGRTIRVKVDPQKDTKAGDKCKKYSLFYPMFTPGLIHSVISKPDWKTKAKDFVNEKKDVFFKETQGLSNGLRVASNWSLNALGFSFFVNYLLELGVITAGTRDKMTEEYGNIVKGHLQDQLERLAMESPVEIFFRIIGQKLAAGNISVPGLNDSPARGKIIGRAKDGSVAIFPDIAYAVLVEHFRSVGQRVAISRNSLRDALAKEGLIQQPKDGRWTTQVRGEGGIRHQAWALEIEAFRKRVAVEVEES